MILGALVSQIEQRFQHEKRARVCLWFDPSREFSRLLPALHRRLGSMQSPPFSLLEYDAEQCHGQVWLKYRIHSELRALSEEERKGRRFLIYLPLAEDRLDSPDERGEHHLELLEEYRIAGLIWRVGGKRPSLFRFLREAGVRLPSNPSDQRKLYDGGFESLLSKYVAKFAERPPAFWEAQLTPDVAQARLLGDADQSIIQLAIDPEAAWADLEEKGLVPEFLAAVEERYGFSHSSQSPSEWIQAFVAAVALTETFQGYKEPSDFPFADRLPPIGLRSHYSDLLRRWLRDSEGRAAWDRWISEVEKDIDLSSWAGSREGLAFAFPHIVRLRWENTVSALDEAASKSSSTDAFFADRLDRIKLEAELARASDRPIGAWQLLLDLGHFVEACRKGEQDAATVSEPSDLAQVFIRNASSIDARHVQLRREAEERDLHSVTLIADRCYATYTNALNERFFKHYVQGGTADLPGVPLVTTQLEQEVWAGDGRRAVIIVDALRFDCALAVRDELRGQDVEVQPMRAELPTITPVGMTALMPLSSASVSLRVKGNNLHPQVNGRDCAQRSQRLAFMTDFGAECRDIDDIESMQTAPDGLGELLVVFGHDQVDHIGHGSADALIRHVNLEVQRIARLVRKLHRWGYETVHVVTDHGFILLEESKLPDEVACDKDWCHVRKERFALVPASADVPLASFPCSWDSSVRVAVPPGLAFFKAEKSFSHGGAALQELIIPHLISKSRVQREKRIDLEVVLPTYELSRTAVKVLLRVKSSATGPQMALFRETERSLTLDVRRTTPPGESVLATPKPKEVRLEASDGEQGVTIFFHTAKTFTKGELLELDIRDADTGEQFPPGGIKLTVGRDM